MAAAAEKSALGALARNRDTTNLAIGPVQTDTAPSWVPRSRFNPRIVRRSRDLSGLCSAGSAHFRSARRGSRGWAGPRCCKGVRQMRFEGLLEQALIPSPLKRARTIFGAVISLSRAGRRSLFIPSCF